MVKRLEFVNYLLPDFGTLLGIAIFWAVLGFGPRMLNLDGDLGRHLTIGQFIIESRQIPLTDIFSYSMPGEPLVPHEWLAQVAFWLAYHGFGLDGVILFCGVLIACTIYFIFILAVKRSLGVFVPVALTILGAAGSSLHWLARPHIFTFLFLAIWIWLIEQLKRKSGKAAWIPPILMLIWVNTHGAFIAGFAYWGIYGMGYLIDRWLKKIPDVETSKLSHFERNFLLGGGLSFLASLVNPAGVDTWKTSIGYLQSRYLVGHTAEYLPPDFQSPATWPFLIFILLSIFFLGLRASKTPTSDLLLLTSWTGMALISARNIPLYMVVATPILTSIICEWMKEPRQWSNRIANIRIYDHLLAAMQRGMRGYMWFVVVLLVCFFLFFGGAKLDYQKKGNQFMPEVFPVDAVNWLETEEISGRIFNYFQWGGYLLYRLWPEFPVFIDGQTDFYGEEMTKKYETVITGAPGWNEVLDAYRVNFVMIPPGVNLDSALKGSGGWELIYKDQTTLFWKRTSPIQ
jgi:hypothetical protein